MFLKTLTHLSQNFWIALLLAILAAISHVHEQNLWREKRLYRIVINDRFWHKQYLRYVRKEIQEQHGVTDEEITIDHRDRVVYIQTTKLQWKQKKEETN